MDIDVLVEFLSIGTLLGFTIVAAGVIILRYQTVEKSQFKLKPEDRQEEVDVETEGDKKEMLKASQSHDDIGKLKDKFKQIPVLKDLSPDVVTAGSVVLMAFFMMCFCIIMLLGTEYVQSATWWAIILLIIFGSGIVCCLATLMLHEQNKSYLTFQVSYI